MSDAALTIVIVTYNSSSHIRECLDSVFASSDDPVEVIVVDNDSTDSTVSILESYDQRINVIRSPKNVGFAKGVNLGLQHARGAYLLLLNPDTIVNQGALVRSIDFLRSESQVGIVGVQNVSAQGALLPSARRWPSVLHDWGATFSGLTRLPVAGKCFQPEVSGDQAQRCDWVPGSFFMFPRYLYEELGGLDERYFLYCEELDYCRQAGNAGYEVVCLKDQTIVHHIGGSTASEDLESASRQIVHYKYESEFRFRYKFGGILGACLYLTGYLLFYLLAAAKNLFKPEKRSAYLSRAYQTIVHARLSDPGSMTDPSGYLYGVPFTLCKMSEALEFVFDRASNAVSCEYVVTPNLDHVCRYVSDSHSRKVATNAAAAYVDGAPVQWLLKLAGMDVPERVTGSGLLPLVLADERSQQAGVFLCGGPPGSAKTLAERTSSASRGWDCPPMGFEHDEDYCSELIQKICDSGAKIVVLGLGSPKQENWIFKYRDRLNSCLVLPVGAAVEFEAGTLTRAPKWMQTTGLEWVHRMVKQPRLVWRYGKNFVFLPWLITLSIGHRLRSKR